MTDVLRKRMVVVMGNLFRHYLLSVKNRLWLVLLCTLVGGMACLLISSAYRQGALAWQTLSTPGAAAGLLLTLLTVTLLAWRGRRPGVEQLREALGVEVVALVPCFTRRARRTGMPLASAQKYRQVCASLQAAPSSLKLVMFASAQAGEGKSTLVSDVAVHLARGGKRVLLVDLHMHRPTLARRFCLRSQAGLTDLLAACRGWLPLEQYCQASAFAGLYVLAAGSTPMTSLEVLRSLTAAQFFPRLQQAPFDYVLFDTPPLCAGVEAQILASCGEALVLVVDSSRASRRALARTRRLLEQMHATRVVGAILNRQVWRDCSCLSPSLAQDPAPPASVEEVTRELPIVCTQPCQLPEPTTGHLPDTGETVQIHRCSAEYIIRPPISLSGLTGTTNGLLGRALGAVTPVPASLQEPEEETHSEHL